jgi:hypothetical protein
MSRLIWNGDRVKQHLVEASVEAIDETLEASRRRAEATTPVLTGEARASLFHDPARATAGGASGVWGSSLSRFLFIEKGFHTLDGRFIPGRHVLANAADAEYRELSRRIARRLG